MGRLLYSIQPIKPDISVASDETPSPAPASQVHPSPSPQLTTECPTQTNERTDPDPDSLSEALQGTDREEEEEPRSRSRPRPNDLFALGATLWHTELRRTPTVSTNENHLRIAGAPRSPRRSEDGAAFPSRTILASDSRPRRVEREDPGIELLRQAANFRHMVTALEAEGVLGRTRVNDVGEEEEVRERDRARLSTEPSMVARDAFQESLDFRIQMLQTIAELMASVDAMKQNLAAL